MVEKYKRITGKLFGETATATGVNPEIAQFGSALEGSYRATTDVEVIQSLSAWSKGFIQAVTPETQFPALPEVTGLIKVLSYHINYLLQSGFPEWDSMTTYYTTNFCRVGNRIFYSLVDNNQNINPLTDDGTNWFEIMKDKANVNLDNLSNTGKKVIDGQWVAKTQTLSTATAVGTYTIDLSSYLPDDNYNYDISIYFAGYRKSGDTNSNISISSEPINTVYDLNNLPSSMFAFSSFDGNHAECGNFSAILHIGTNRKFYFNIVKAALGNSGLYAYAYRRIGTNT